MLLGAAFLMATSAIGPGFLTQTAVFTQKYLASFSAIILLTIIIDIVVQVNIWRIIVAAGKRGQEIANDVLPGLGYFVSLIIVIGGIAFNIGNVAGTGMALNTLFGLDARIGAAISAVICILIFTSKEMGSAMDRFAQVLGVVMVLLAAYVAVAAHPPVGEAVVRTFAPTKFEFLPLVTLVGGTVGGYITFAGGHRLIEGNMRGLDAVKEATKSAVFGIVIAGIMRYALFFADLGVATKGVQFDPVNPAATPFLTVAGVVGYKLFGLVLWAAATTSVVGCSFTTLSFIKTYFKPVEENFSKFIIGFIVFCTLFFIFIGKPVTLLVFAGAINGLILPITLGSMLLACKNKKIVGDYNHPTILLILGIIVFLIEVYGGINSLTGIAQLFK
ncbi:MAG: NRAMP family divalent metal transporter [Thermovenabulum sp.]|uniref:NRAMP family divalent metal transporter n=1 Tax=Thermovenabulum sp. TaxID=3100335 RepID=UPI003C7BAD8B